MYHRYALELTTSFLKEVWMPIIFKGCSCFSLVLCSHFVGYDLLHVEPADSTFGSFSAKLPFGEISYSEVPFGENSVQRYFCTAKIPFDENSLHENSFGEISFCENF